MKRNVNLLNYLKLFLINYIFPAFYGLLKNSTKRERKFLVVFFLFHLFLFDISNVREILRYEVNWFEFLLNWFEYWIDFVVCF